MPGVCDVGEWGNFVSPPFFGYAQGLSVFFVRPLEEKHPSPFHVILSAAKNPKSLQLTILRFPERQLVEDFRPFPSFRVTF